MSTTANMGLTLPDVGGDVGTWGSELNDSLNTVDTHDHSSGKGTKVTPAGLNINSDLEMNDQRLIEVRSLKFQQLTGTLEGIANARSLFYSGSSFGVVTDTGGLVYIVSNGQMNPAAAGGIGGTYSGSNALVSYTAGASARYVFYSDQTTSTPARIWCADIRILEPSASDASGVNIKCPPEGINASYNLNLPNSVPTAAAGVHVMTWRGTTGQHGFMSGTRDIEVSTVTASADMLTRDIVVTRDVLCTRVVSAAQVTASLDMLVSRNLVVSQDISNQTLTASVGVVGTQVRTLETGLRHADKIISLSPAVGWSAAGTDWTMAGGAGVVYANAAGANYLWIPIPSEEGSSITQGSFRVRDTASTVTLRLLKVLRADGTITQIGATQTSAGTSADQTLDLQITGSIPIDTLYTYLYEIKAGAINHRAYGGIVTIKRP